MSVGMPRTPRGQGRMDARSAYGHEETTSLQKKGYAIYQYYKRKKALGGTDKSLSDTLRDYDIRAVQQKQTDEDRSGVF